MRKQDNNSTMVIAVLCAVIIVIFSIVAVMLGKSHSGSGTNVMTKGSDPLPEGSAGNWWVPADSHVLQSPRNADMSEDAALAEALTLSRVSISKQTGQMRVKFASDKILNDAQFKRVERLMSQAFPAVRVKLQMEYPTLRERVIASLEALKDEEYFGIGFPNIDEAAKFKKKNVVIKKAKAYSVKNNNGKLAFKLKSVSNKKFAKYFKVNAKNGKITVKKKLKKVNPWQPKIIWTKWWVMYQKKKSKKYIKMQ